jgi:4-hydroxybutyrate CoA-transferase
VTHDPVRLAGLDTFIAINSALEVDLFGQCNLELIGGKAVSGPGGAPDFAHAAARSENGLSIVALPATSGSKGISRIVSKLGPDSVASLPRTDVDMIVTEFGRADLRGLSTFERADALIAIASPEAREGLRQAWGNIASSL